MSTWLIILFSEMLLLSAATLLHYAWDKRRSRRGGWRVPENRLHLLSLLGGWPGALLGQRWLRHKTVKRKFRIVFWLTVFAHIAVATGITYLVATQ
jgi:uncharacterized membrane protein YsdA (DUF1294 family)